MCLPTCKNKQVKSIKILIHTILSQIFIYYEPYVGWQTIVSVSLVVWVRLCAAWLLLAHRVRFRDLQQQRQQQQQLLTGCWPIKCRCHGMASDHNTIFCHKFNENKCNNNSDKSSLPAAAQCVLKRHRPNPATNFFWRFS